MDNITTIPSSWRISNFIPTFSNMLRLNFTNISCVSCWVTYRWSIGVS